MDRIKNREKKFTRELDLVEMVKSSWSSVFFPKDKLMIFQEFESTHGIADLVYINLPKEWKNKLSISKVNPGWAYLFYSIGSRSFDLNEITRKSGCTEIYAKKVLKDLEISGFLKKLNNGNWKLIESIKPIAKEIMSIECKLKDWKSALSQAIRYQDFSHSSWVVLDHHVKDLLHKNLKEFEKFNIGLVVASPSGKYDLLYKAKKQEPKHISSFWFANSVVAKNLSTNYLINSL